MRCSEGKLIFELSRSLLLSLRRSASVPVYLVVLPLLLRANSPVEQRQFSGYCILTNCPCSRRPTDKKVDHDRDRRPRAHSGEPVKHIKTSALAIVSHYHRRPRAHSGEPVVFVDVRIVIAQCKIISQIMKLLLKIISPTLFKNLKKNKNLKSLNSPFGAVEFVRACGKETGSHRFGNKFSSVHKNCSARYCLPPEHFV